MKQSYSEEVRVLNEGDYIKQHRPRSWLQIAPLSLAMCFSPALDALYYLGMDKVRISGVVSPFQLFHGLLLIAMVIGLRGSRISVLTRRNEVTPLFVLACYALGSALFSPYPFLNIVDGMQILYLYLVFVSAKQLAEAQLLGRRWYKTVPLIMLGSLITLQLLALACGVKGAGEYSSAAVGLSARPGSIGGYAVAVLPWLLASPMDGKMSIIGTGVLCCVAVMCMRRNAFVVIAISVILILLYQIRHTHNTARKMALYIAPIALCLAFMFFASYTTTGRAFTHRLEHLDVTKGETISGRTKFQLIALRHLVSRGAAESVFGEGSGAIADVMQEGGSGRIGAHNTWIDKITAYGFIGFVLLLWFSANIMNSIRRSTQSRRVVATAIGIVIVLSGLVMDGILSPSSSLLYAMVGVVAGWPFGSCTSRQIVIGRSCQRFHKSLGDVYPWGAKRGY